MLTDLETWQVLEVLPHLKSMSDRQKDMGRSRGATAPKNVISMWSVLQVRLSKTGGD